MKGQIYCRLLKENDFFPLQMARGELNLSVIQAGTAEGITG
jgi:hypothetical protein